MSRWLKRTLTVLLILLLLLAIASFVAGNFMYNLALDPASDKSMVYGAEHNQMRDETDAAVETPPQDAHATWLDDTGYRDEAILSEDGLRLHAYAVDNPDAGHRWAILCHGYGGQGRHMNIAGKNFYDLGFSLLIPDARGHGQSEGDYIGMGWPERRDIVGWIDLIVQNDPDAQIVLFGVSMGGATVMMTAGEALPDNVRAIVEDCGYTSVWDEFAYQLDALFGLPTFPVLDAASLVTRIRAGYTFREADAVAQVAKSQTPILFIHGDQDTFVPSWMVHTVYAAAPEPKELLIAPGAGHGGASAILGDAYWDTIDAFITPYLTD